MMTTLDLRSMQQDDRREPLFDALDDADGDETVTLLTDSNADGLLTHYQITRGHSLDWEAAQQDGDDVRIQVTKGDAVAESDLTEFDVRDMPPQRRHEVLTETFDRLDPGEGFVLVNDHDPKPLYHELHSTRGDVFEWEYVSRDQQEWRIEIVKTDESEAMDDDVVASFDVREIPKQQRHPTIHHRYGSIADGETIEITAPHEPRPLRREFQQRYGESFTWDVVENEPGRCRVRITKQAAETEASGGDSETSSADDSLTETKELDVRDLPPAQRHEQIFEAYANLQMGEGFVLVNDHDPKPLYHQFDAEAGDEFHWEYRQQEPGEFRVLIGKDETTGGDPDGNNTSTAPF